MKFLLDTNAVIAVLKQTSHFVERMKRHGPGDFALSSITLHELAYGAFRSKRVEENLARIGKLRFPVLEFDGDDARKAGEVRAVLADRGTPIGPYDVLISGHALARDLILVTHNTREFDRVPELRVEDWEN